MGYNKTTFLKHRRFAANKRKLTDTEVITSNVHKIVLNEDLLKRTLSDSGIYTKSLKLKRAFR